MMTNDSPPSDGRAVHFPDASAVMNFTEGVIIRCTDLQASDTVVPHVHKYVESDR